MTQMHATSPTAARYSLRNANDDRTGAMNGAASTVFVVDGSAEFRLALSRVLEDAGYAVRLFESAEDFLATQNTESCGCVLLDTCLSGMSGLELQRSLETSPRWRPIIFLSGPCEIQTSTEAMKAGAVDFLTKPFESARLLGAVAQALERGADKRQADAIRSIIQQRLNTLTRRERQVMELVIGGWLNKQIAAVFGSGVKTVKVQRASVMSKMRVRSVPELVQLGARVGMTLELAQSARAAARGRPNVQYANASQPAIQSLT
jgi:FixJ family two-component response regulator